MEEAMRNVRKTVESYLVPVRDYPTEYGYPLRELLI